MNAYFFRSFTPAGIAGGAGTPDGPAGASAIAGAGTPDGPAGASAVAGAALGTGAAGEAEAPRALRIRAAEIAVRCMMLGYNMNI